MGFAMTASADWPYINSGRPQQIACIGLFTGGLSGGSDRRLNHRARVDATNRTGYDEKRVFRLLDQSIKYRLVINYMLGFVCLASAIVACGSPTIRPAQANQRVAQVAVRQMDLCSQLRAPHGCAARPPNASSLYPKINCQSYRLKYSRQSDKT